MKIKVYKRLASLIVAWLNCVKTGNTEWEAKHEAKIEKIVKMFMPYGSGFDNGTKISFDASEGNKLVFLLGYHTMNEWGFYTGWINMKVTVTPDLASDFIIKIKCLDRHSYYLMQKYCLKDYILEILEQALDVELLSKEY